MEPIRISAATYSNMQHTIKQVIATYSKNVLYFFICFLKIVPQGSPFYIKVIEVWVAEFYGKFKSYLGFDLNLAIAKAKRDQFCKKKKDIGHTKFCSFQLVAQNLQ